MLKSGISEKRITPHPGIELCGYIARIQPSIGVYDDLYARALYMENNGKRIIWIHCDLIGFSNYIADRIRKVVAEKTGLLLNDIFLSATHTHAGPATVELRKCGDIDPEYINCLEKVIEESAEEAILNLEPVTLCFSETELKGISVDRRCSGKNSHIDNKLSVLAFRKRDGSFKAVIANYAMHNVGLSSNNRNISADIAGFAAKLAGKSIPGKPAVFMTNGGCGNINPAIMTNDYSGVEKSGTILGNAVINEIPGLKPCSKNNILSRFSKFELPLKLSSVEELSTIMDKHRLYYESLKNKNAGKRLYDALNSWYESTKN
ncbi:MAG: neutral/alkaline non-lysosomal ceramidase N-terminal domain-containing protein, partial [Victivallaceae bacterium]|nr:neutral/alkaline non-lysosomal ceramidase N-terminal domain-containing protein [Victivallaceae bacterium]